MAEPRVNWFTELQLAEDATDKEIRQKRHLSRRMYHPDKAAEDEKEEYEEKLKRIEQGCDILLDPRKRAELESYLRRARAEAASAQAQRDAEIRAAAIREERRRAASARKRDEAREAFNRKASRTTAGSGATSGSVGSGAGSTSTPPRPSSTAPPAGGAYTGQAGAWRSQSAAGSTAAPPQPPPTPTPGPPPGATAAPPPTAKPPPVRATSPGSGAGRDIVSWMFSNWFRIALVVGSVWLLTVIVPPIGRFFASVEAETELSGLIPSSVKDDCWSIGDDERPKHTSAGTYCQSNRHGTVTYYLFESERAVRRYFRRRLGRIRRRYRVSWGPSGSCKAPNHWTA